MEEGSHPKVEASRSRPQALFLVFLLILHVPFSSETQSTFATTISIGGGKRIACFGLLVGFRGTRSCSLATSSSHDRFHPNGRVFASGGIKKPTRHGLRYGPSAQKPVQVPNKNGMAHRTRPGEAIWVSPPCWNPPSFWDCFD